MADNTQSGLTKPPITTDNKTTQASKPQGLKSLDSILDNLQCTMCLNYLQTPVMMCFSGHNICNQCYEKPKNVRCFVCQSPFNGQRNLALEDIVEKLFVLCPNATYGCSYRIPEKNLKLHTDCCKFRQFSCPFGVVYRNCPWRGGLSSLKLHICKCHSKNCSDKFGSLLTATVDADNRDANFQVMFHGRHIFVCHAKIEPKEKTATWAVQIADDHVNAANWTFEVSFHRKNSDRCMRFFENCTSFESFRDVFSEATSVKIPFSILSKFLTQEREFNFMINVKYNGPQTGSRQDLP